MPKWLRAIINFFKSPAGKRATEIVVDVVEDELAKRQKPPTPPSKR